MTAVVPTFQGEVMLAGWRESHSAGATVTFWLPDAADLESFKHLTSRKGGTAGQRFMAVLVQIGDDEQPVAPADSQWTPEQQAQLAAQGKKPLELNRVAPAPKGGPLSRAAADLGRLPEFRKFLRQFVGHKFDQWDDTEAWVAGVIRCLCKVESRAELDHSDEAAELFHSEVRQPWLAYARRTGLLR